MSILFLFSLLSTVSCLCQPECSFKNKLITSKTIKNWPSTCETVCGNIILNSDTNLSEAKLKDIFSFFKNLEGSLTIENTTFKNLNFLSSLTSLESNEDGLTIRFNSKLTNVDVIKTWRSMSVSLWNIYENPKLDTESICDKGLDYQLFRFNIFGNLKNCDCKFVQITPLSLPYYPNCTSITGGYNTGLTISQIDESTDLSGLLNLKNLSYSILEIYNTDLQNFSFLKYLEKIEMRSGNMYNLIGFRDNPELRRLGFDSLEILGPLYQELTVIITNNHPDFCMTTNELQVFANHKISFEITFIKICNDFYRKDGQKVCSFEKLSSMNIDCQHIIGDVLINSENEKDAWRLGNMSNIYGSLTVEDTRELIDLGFLAKLEQVADFRFDESRPLIRINSNKKLQKVELPSMKYRLYPNVQEQIIEINGNQLDIFRNQRECLTLQEHMQTAIKYNRKSCDKLPIDTLNNNSNIRDPVYDDYLFDHEKIDNRDFLLDKKLINFYAEAIKKLKEVYNIAVFVNFFVNIPHLLILTRQGLRSNLVYIIMIGICISDLILSIGKMIPIFMNSNDSNCKDVFPYNQVLIDILSRCTQIMSRRTSGFLALFIAIFRAFSVIFPMSNAVNFLTKPTSGWLIVVFIMVICGGWSSLYYFKTIILEVVKLCNEKNVLLYKQDTFGEHELVLRLIDGYIALFVSFSYVFVAIALVIALAKAKERRKNFKRDKSTNTTMLVIIMAVFMFISETSYSTIFILSSFFFVDFEERIYFEQLEFLAMTFSMANSIAHCLICYSMSSQYRDVVKGLICSGKENEIPVKKMEVSSGTHPTTIDSGETKRSSKKSF